MHKRDHLKEQFGFIKDVLRDKTLYSSQMETCASIAMKPIGVRFFCDLAKAFDCANHAVEFTATLVMIGPIH